MKTSVGIAFGLVLAFGVPSAMAQPAGTVDAEVDQAKKCFSANDYAGAFQHYQKAFALDSSALNSLRVFIASCYAEDLSTSMSRFDVWLQKKHADAKGLGDKDASWDSIDDAMRAARGASTRLQARVDDLSSVIREKDAEIKALQDQLEQEETKIRIIKSGYDQAVQYYAGKLNERELDRTDVPVSHKERP